MAALGGDGLRLLSVSRPQRQPESTALSGPGPGLCCWVSVFSCFSLACSYVGSLYVWKSELPRCGGCARGRNPRPREAGLWAGLCTGVGPRWQVAATGPLNSLILPRDHPAVIKRRFTSVLVVSSLSPLCVLLWRELTGIQVRRRRGTGQAGKDSKVFVGGNITDAPFPVAQPGTSLLTLMGFRLEGIFPAALLPLLLTMVSPASFFLPCVH